MLNDSSSPVPGAAAPAKKSSEVTWGPVAAILITLSAFVAAEFAASFALGIVPLLFGWSKVHSAAWLNSVPGQFIYVVLAEGLTIAGLWLYSRGRKLSLAALGFRRSPRWGDAAYAVMGFAAYFVLVAVVTSWAASRFHINLDQKQELGFDAVVGTIERLMAFVSLVVLPPIVEEVMFRGFLFAGLRKKLPFPAVALLVSLIFASLHLLEGSGGLLWVAGIDTFVLSLVLCYVREKTGNLWAGIAVHMLKNCVAFLYLYVFVVR